MTNLNPVGFIPGAFRVPHVYGGFPNGSRVIARPVHMPNLAMAPNGLMQNVHLNNASYIQNVLPVGSTQRNVMPPQMRMIPNHPPIFKQSQVGSCKMRLLYFADHLGGDSPNQIRSKKDIMHWVEFTRHFFAEDTSMNYNNRTKKSEIKYQLIPRFYQTFFESGVTKIQLILGITQESVQYNNGIPVGWVECKAASIVYHYENGTQVVTTGHLKVAFINLKITHFEFEMMDCKEYVPRLLKEFITSSSENLINGQGIPLKTVRCLEIGEGMDFMQEIMAYTIDYPNLGPLEALRILASQNANPNVAMPMVNHPLEMSSSSAQHISKNDIKNEASNFNGAPPTPNANDLQTSATTPVRTPTPMHTPTPTPKSTPSPLVVNGGIGSPHQKLSTKSPAIGGNNIPKIYKLSKESMMTNSMQIKNDELP